MATLNLYLVEWKDGGGYDQYDLFVVCCATEEEARNTKPGGRHINTGWKEDNIFNDWIKHSKKDELEITLLGSAKPDLPAGIVCASYHHG